MKVEFRRWLYSVDEPEGKIFEEGEEAIGEWHDTPNFAKKPKLKIIETEESLEKQIELEDLKTRYMEKFHKKPHHKMKAETILKALNDDSEHNNNGSAA